MTTACSCKKPKPVEETVGTWERLMGVELYQGGARWMACEKCGAQLTPEVPITEEEAT